MTPRTIRARGASLEVSGDSDLLAGLWQEAPFARLPIDAPAELVDQVQDIENPGRVYAVHRASRRHSFQLLVERYTIQLRYGCGQLKCATPTCFTCRKRLAGKAPIRRYNTTSARTLAVYLASQDNPQDGLCPTLQQPKENLTAVGTLIFSRRSSTPLYSPPKKSITRDSTALVKDKSMADPRRRHSPQYMKTPETASDPSTSHILSENGCPSQFPPIPSRDVPKAGIDVAERPVSKDHRSFAANLFDTVAFKMLEWLTPRGVEAVSQQFSLFQDSKQTKPEASSDRGQILSQPRPPSTDSTARDLRAASTSISREPNANPSGERGGQDEGVLHGEASLDPSCPATGPKPRQGSKPKQRPPASSKPKRTMSLEPFPPPAIIDDPKSAVLSPRLNGFQREKPTRPPKTNATVTGRGIPEMPAKPAFFENVPSPTPLPIQQRTILQFSTEDGSSREDSDNHHPYRLRKRSSTHDHKEDVEKPKLEVPAAWLHNALPQSLSQLNVELVDFICDVFQEDDTAENHPLSPTDLGGSQPKAQNASKPLTRQKLRRSSSLKKQWKEFNEQTIFNVLSDPQAAVQSFTQDGRLYDSQTLWYCLHRLNRVAPSLVFHSLWIAAGSLFAPPTLSQAPHSPKNKIRRQTHTKLTDVEAGNLISICMHALVAAAPIVPDSRTLYEMSRIRSNGLVLAGGGSVARQPPSRCLDYNDAFSHELAIRLARRLFCSITARRSFAQKLCPKVVAKETSADLDILRPLVNQLDFLSTGSVPILEFPQPDRLLHETRVPTILLDWARTIILMEWNGRPDISVDGAFGGALSFIETMCKFMNTPIFISKIERKLTFKADDSRNLLLLGDVQFRVDFLSDRLDSIDMPVDWLSFNSTRWRRHILDYPYMFSPETLVSFFRSINFARMSRMFEESSSLKTRMSAIVDPGSLITNPHHKTVLQDLLRTASSKYLILEIGRGSVVRDAFDQLWRREERELLRPLKVHLGEEGGEEGFDSGGVQQEFFRLAIAECLDPSYGAFAVDERTRMAWFVPGSIIEDWKYELVGLLVSLALYNGLTLPITFPRALYRKLLGKPVQELHHIADGWPDLASGLTTLLEWDEKDGLVEDIFARTYEFSVSAFGSNISREMMKNGSAWPPATAASEDLTPPHMANPEDAPLVTNNNRDAYVNDYIRYLTDTSIRPQFDAFERGFRVCLDSKSLSLLSPPILQSLVEGVQEIDISELRRYARYVGWDASHHTIKDFWSIVKKYDDRMKRRLLEFVTSSDRVPVGGMKNLQFVIQKNGEEGDAGHLPTAYTCYGTLLLPEYKDKEALRERLGMALENAQGFGFA
ncbi:Fc.00g113740.m01.CDS01 [Cosmosporella sp. VM-42]